MTTKQQLAKITDQQEDTICSLRIELHSDYDRFNQCVLGMAGALSGEGIMAELHGANSYQEALRALASIEDAIKRFREGRKQAFEED